MKRACIFIIVLFLLASCSSPAPVPTSIATLIPTNTMLPSNTPKPTLTATSTLTPTPAPTNTPVPVAVPLVYPGWTDKAYSHVCVDGMTIYLEEVDIPGIAPLDVAGLMIPAAKKLLQTMGMQVVPMDAEECEAAFVFFVNTSTALKAEFHENGDVCVKFTEIELAGDFTVMVPPVGGDGFVISLNTNYKIPDAEFVCNPAQMPPTDPVWQKAVVDAYIQVYGDAAREAALSVPELRTYAETLK